MREPKEPGSSGSRNKGLGAGAIRGLRWCLGLDRRVEIEADMGQGLMIQKGKDQG